MTHDHECACGRPIPDTAVICVHCGHQLDAALADISGYHGLAYDLDIAIGRRTHAHLTAEEIAEEKRAPGVLPPTPLPYNPRASTVAADLARVLRKWAYIIKNETGAGYPPRRMAQLAAWLRPHVGWIRYREDASTASEDILTAVADARRVCDRPADRLYAGPCDECGAGLYALAGALIVECRECELVYEVAARREWLLAALDDHLAHAAQMSRLLTYLGIRLADSSVRMYAVKGRVAAHGRDVEGRPLYRLGDVVRTYYGGRQGARAS